MCRLKDCPETHKMAENIVRAYSEALQALPITALKGAEGWYARANNFVQETAESLAVPFDVVLWLTAYFSQNADWNTNKKSVTQFIQAYRTGNVYECEGLFATQKMRKKAAQIMSGKLAPTYETLTSTKSKAYKTQNFYRNIGQPLAPYPVTVDRHAARIATANDSVSVPTGGAYEKVAEAYRVAADIVGVLPNVIQSVTWTAITGDLP